MAIRDVSVEVYGTNRWYLQALFECVRRSKPRIASRFSKVAVRIDPTAVEPKAYELINVLDVVMKLPDGTEQQAVLGLVRGLDELSTQGYPELGALSAAITTAAERGMPCRTVIWERRVARFAYEVDPNGAKVVLETENGASVVASASWPMPLEILWPARRIVRRGTSLEVTFTDDMVTNLSVE